MGLQCHCRVLQDRSHGIQRRCVALALLCCRVFAGVLARACQLRMSLHLPSQGMAGASTNAIAGGFAGHMEGGTLGRGEGGRGGGARFMASSQNNLLSRAQARKGWRNSPMGSRSARVAAQGLGRRVRARAPRCWLSPSISDRCRRAPFKEFQQSLVHRIRAGPRR